MPLIFPCLSPVTYAMIATLGWVAEWLCSGLQSRGRRFDSDPSLHIYGVCSHQQNATEYGHTARVAE